MRLGFHPAPVLLGFVLGPRLEENFRRALTLSRGDLATFVDSPISATFVGLAVVLAAAQVYLARKARVPQDPARQDPSQAVASRPAVVLEEP